MLDTDPISLHFTIPATDHLGRETVQGHLRFHAEHIDLHWRLKGNVFTKGPGDMTLIEIPYSRVTRVDLQKRWFRPPLLVLHVDEPTLVQEIPGIELGQMKLEVDPDSRLEVKKLNDFIDFRRSLFLLDETNERLLNLKK
ncbi:MAG: hypothetical protein Q7Q71_04515 [Verrucomicrobiota bacterium JB023]|nr:hypothetical protein [Verrucomicrobiota bacterium JB023]